MFIHIFYVHNFLQRQRSLESNRSCVSSLNLSPPNPEPLVVHGGVVVCLIKLLPSLPSIYAVGNHPQATALQDYLAHVLKSLVRRLVTEI